MRLCPSTEASPIFCNLLIEWHAPIGQKVFFNHLLVAMFAVVKDILSFGVLIEMAGGKMS
jgi:hypothetical protein